MLQTFAYYILIYLNSALDYSIIKYISIIAVIKLICNYAV